MSSLVFLGRIAALARLSYCYEYRRSSEVCRFVCLSVGLSVTTMNSAKTAEPIVMLFGMLTRGPKKPSLDGGPDPPCEGAIFEGYDVEIFPHAASTVPIGPDVGISPHAVDQRSHWLATEAVECHIKFSQ